MLVEFYINVYAYILKYACILYMLIYNMHNIYLCIYKYIFIYAYT